MKTSDAFNIHHLLKKDKARFRERGYEYIANFLTQKGLQRIQMLYQSCTSSAIRKDFRMKQTNNSSRHMSVINGIKTNKNSCLKSWYKNNELIEELSGLTGLNIVECPEKIENIIFSCLDSNGDEHGLHYDDFPIALIIGVHNTVRNPMNNGNVEFKDLSGDFQSFQLKEGDAYIMRSDIIEHCVSPINKNEKRVALNFTYSEFGKLICPNGSAYELLK